MVAYDAGAVRETLRGGGVLLKDKEPASWWPSWCAACSRTAPCARGVLATQARAIAEVRATDFGALLLDRLARCSRVLRASDSAAPVRIDQWVPALHRGDAIGDSARLMRDAFRSWGHAADVYALELDEDLAGDGRASRSGGRAAPRDVVILHYALPSPLTPALREHRGRRVLLHHNITPPEFFAGYDEEMARICRIGREELATLARPRGPRPGGQRVQPAGAGGARASRARACCPSTSTSRRYREPPNPVLRRAARGRPHQPPLRGPPRARTSGTRT